jgi:N12 class adenine-specific DNA methylase
LTQQNLFSLVGDSLAPIPLPPQAPPPTLIEANGSPLPPASPAARVKHNLKVIGLLEELNREDRAASAQERAVLSRWAGWGAVPEVFDNNDARYTEQREQLLALLDEESYAAARRSTLNAHYTHPLIADAMWELARRLSFPGRRVLEPGCGAGVFIARAPEGVVGVELDPTTAAVARTLHPTATIHTASFADLTLPEGGFDLVIGNVPFGDFALYDPVHNKGRHSIHNHFLLKSLALLAPGGLLVALTSRYTLDAQRTEARREMQEMADLIAAVRLPSRAHRRVAGTDVITDLVVLRRRAIDQSPASASWADTAATVIDGEELTINRYFVEHPEHIAGALAVTSSAYGPDLDVAGDSSPEALYAAITALAAENVPPEHATPDLHDAATPSVDGAATAPDSGGGSDPVVVDVYEQWDGHILALTGGGFAEVIDGSAGPLAVPKSATREMRVLLTLRDQASALLAEEAAHVADPAHLDQLRAQLRESYERYRRTYGPINRYTTHPTGRIDPDTGEPVVRRSYPRTVRLLMRDPLGPLVLSLEVFDDDTQTAAEADLLRRRVVRDRPAVRSVTTPEDALAVCYDQLGRVDVDTVARLLGLTAEDARCELAELVYEDPDTEVLVAAAEYLSGNVAIKLDRAREAAAVDPRFDVNAAALEAVLPLPLGADEVDAKMGAVWISDTVHQQFLSELLEDPNAIVEYGGGNVWAVQARNYGTLVLSEWGTQRMPAPEIASALLQQKPIVVKDRLPDERYIVNPDETAAAQEKAAAMQQRFGEWCWEDPERASALLAEYNTRFNSLVLRDYSVLGEALTLPGLAESFLPSAHQRTAVARIISEPAVGLFHEVGAGKTAAMVIAAHELRRLGLVNKPVVVVPNHMLEQFAREWLQLYPLARVLAASTDDLAKDNRRRFIARAVANDWDGIIMTRSAFERLGVSAPVQRIYLQRELDAVRAQLDEQSNRGAKLTVKKLERMVARAEAALERRLDSVVDVGLTFEETAIDYMFLDEAHAYKNLATISNIPGAAIGGSKRATDLHMKIDYLRRARGERVTTFATATPIANSITEAHVMCRFLRPDLLETAGVEHFDAWAATFGETVTQMEMAVTAGGTYRLKTRFARFHNVPEMLRVWHLAADVKTAEDLKLPAPPIKPRPDGEPLPEPVVIPAPAEVTAYLHDLAERAEKIRAGGVPPEDDNMLLISTDGRKAALDMRLVGAGVPVDGVCKLDVVADNIARIYGITRNVAYRITGTDVRHPTLGSLQIVFCDLSTPNPRRWNAYHELRRLLIERGVPGELVRFVHEAKNDSEKARLFEACRSGQVAVLLGSTEKMGVGTNIQARAIALHHIDCPWRPADIQQREGRILRQGNQNSGVRIYRYVVEGSFDAYSWQTVERKARFIGQVMRGRLDLRSIEDIGDNTLSFAEVKALAAGDTLILEQATVSADLTRLQRLQRAHRSNQSALEVNVSHLTDTLERLEREITAIDGAIERAIDTRAEKFSMTVDGSRYTKRAAAATALAEVISDLSPGQEARKIGRLGGLDISLRVSAGSVSGSHDVFAGFDGLPCPSAHGILNVVRNQPATLIRQLEARLNGLETLRAKTVAATASAQTERRRAQNAIGTPFKHADALEQARTKLASIEAELGQKAHAQELAASSSGSPDTAQADDAITDDVDALDLAA